MLTLSGYLKKHLKSNITKEQCKDTGLALLLVFLLLGYFTQNAIYYGISIPVILVVMIWPGLLKPVGIFWFSFSSLLGSVMSRIILTIIFYAVVVPVGYFRKLAGIDNLKLNQFRKSKESVMLVRDHLYDHTDIEKPY